MKRFVATTALILSCALAQSAPAYAQLVNACDKPVDVKDMTSNDPAARERYHTWLHQNGQCLEQMYHHAENDMNKTYHRLLRKYKNKEATSNDYQKLIRDTQRHWINFRNSTCSFEKDEPKNKAGQDYNVSLHECLWRKTRERADQLKTYLNCVEDCDPSKQDCSQHAKECQYN